MNKNYAFILFVFWLTSHSAYLSAQIVNIPDANFKAALLAHSWVIDTNGDGEIQVSEAQTFSRTLYVSSENIADLTGIEAFTAITGLHCHVNQLTSLDITANTAITLLYCNDNQLTSLDITANTALTYLSCYNNQLTSLDITANTALTDLRCYNNQLPSLDVTANTALTNLSCDNNQLPSLDVTANTALTALSCGYNQLTSLAITANTALTYLGCYYNQLPSLDVTANTALTDLICGNNQLTSLNLSNNIALTALHCDNNQLTSLDMTGHTALRVLGCRNNQLTSLNLSNNIVFSWLGCSNNQLSSLDLRNGNNMAFTYYYSTGNPNLNCISVDDPLWSTTNLTNRDAQTQFSSNCNCDIFSIDIDSIEHISCSDPGYARAFVSGPNGPFQYEWLNAPLSSDSILIANTAGIYTLKVTDINLCESLRKLILKEPKVKTGFELNTNLNVVGFRPGRLCSLNLSAWNDGCIVENGQLQLIYNGPLTFYSSGISPNTQAGDTLNWDLGTMEYDLSDFLTSLQFRVDTLAQAGDRVCFEVLITPLSGDTDSTNNLKSYCFDVVNSYDPNDKQVYPQGVCAENYTLKNQPLTYTIRFQNTGNAPAIDVYLIDSLSPYLNINTIRVLESSHEGLITEVLENDVLKFDFKNINLADSLSDEAGSKGFVTYEIEPYSGLSDGTVIENSAGIYFDFNAPVITNTTKNTLVSVLPQITASTISETVCGSYMSPNLQVYTSSGIYSAVVPNTSGCDSIITINLTVNNPSTSNMTENVCQQFIAADGQIFTNTGNYIVTIPNAFGCDSIINYQLTINKVDTSVAIIEPIIASNAFGASYQWLDCGNAMAVISGETNQYYVVPQEGVYAVAVNQNGCTDTSACTPMSLQRLTNLDGDSRIILYPNPTDGIFHLDLGQTYQNTTIKITDLQGREIKREKALNQQHLELELNEADGIYLVHVLADGQELSVIRLIKN